MKTRSPAVAGRFYPDSPSEITSLLDQVVSKEHKTINRSLAVKYILGGVVPHAGYMFSAYQAMHFFEILKESGRKPQTFIIINPNHTGYGKEISLDDHDAWETPYGNVNIDLDFCRETGFEWSADAHKFEHSGEVLVPMLQYTFDHPFKIVPITLSVQNQANARLIANTLFSVSERLQRDICLLASSDFSHYVNPETGKKLDDFVLNEILQVNPEGVYEQVKAKNISVCGFGPIMSLMYYA